jgi:GH15 family glucan-1,4-alpha-glucosidase
MSRSLTYVKNHVVSRVAAAVAAITTIIPTQSRTAKLDYRFFWIRTFDV